ncbi:MAG: hypothetical protein HYV90_05470 [Candidatus Woesebacteria bacterium]|nr:MAG: hypothetical protein HYV90_05470 [Candidatus Woesebacteria bacterium]
MANKESLLGALLTEEVQGISKKLNFWGKPIELPTGLSWTSESHLTLEKFLEANPLPANARDIPLYGAAWEFVWGKETPKEIKEAKEVLLIRARTGMEVTEEEKIWLKIIAVDTDMF